MKNIIISLRRAPYQSLAAFLVLFFSLLLIGSILLSTNFLSGLLGYVETRPQVTVYFQTKTSASDIARLKDELTKQTDKVSQVKYISKEDAFKTYKELNKDNSMLLEMVSADILPASIEIRVKKPVYLSEIAAFVKKQPGVDEVDFQKDISDKLLKLTTAVRVSALTLFTFLVIMSIVVLTTTIMFKIALKKDEIELLRLIGASKGYIRRPFMGEAVFLGITAALAAFAVILGVIYILKPFLEGYLRGVSLLEVTIFGWLLAVWPINIYIIGFTLIVITLFAVVIAILASYIATRKYLI